MERIAQALVSWGNNNSMIKTKSVYYEKIEKKDGARILVMRHCGNNHLTL